MSNHTHHLFTPHEYAYLNHSVLQDSHNFTVPSGHNHFVLKSRPQSSVQLRNEMLQRGELSLSLPHYSLPISPSILSLTFSLLPSLFPTAGTDFSQTGSLIKDRHLLQRQMSTSNTSS